MKESNRQKLMELTAELLKNKGHIDDIELPKSISKKSKRKIYDYIKGMNGINHGIVWQLKEILDSEK